VEWSSSDKLPLDDDPFHTSHIDTSRTITQRGSNAGNSFNFRDEPGDDRSLCNTPRSPTLRRDLTTEYQVVSMYTATTSRDTVQSIKELPTYHP